MQEQIEGGGGVQLGIHDRQRVAAHDACPDGVLVHERVVVGIRRSAGTLQGRMRGQAKTVVEPGTAFALLLLSLRQVETEEIVGPFAKASRAVEAKDADIVIVDGVSGWHTCRCWRNTETGRADPRPEAVEPGSRSGGSPRPCMISGQDEDVARKPAPET